MNSESLKSFAYDSLLNTGVIMGVNMSGIPQMTRSLLPNNEIGANISAGSTYVMTNQILEMITTGSSKFNRKDWVGLSDDVAFNSGISYAVNRSDINGMVYNGLDVTGLSTNVKLNLTEGLTMSAISGLANFLDVGTDDNVIFDLIRRPVSTSLKMIS